MRLVYRLTLHTKLNTLLLFRESVFLVMVKLILFCFGLRVNVNNPTLILHNTYSYVNFELKQLVKLVLYYFIIITIIHINNSGDLK